MFFIMEDKEEEFTCNVDQFFDSYARDTTVDELTEVRDRASKHGYYLIPYRFSSRWKPPLEKLTTLWMQEQPIG